MKTERASDLNVDLASLRIDRQQPARRRRRWPLLLFLPAVVVLAALYGLRVRQSLQGVEVGAMTVPGPGPGTTSSGTAVLTASGYLVPSRKAVVSAKIQGRLSELRVEEGSRVRKGEIIARLENADFKAQKLRAAATIRKAEADLAEYRRLALLAERLAREKVVSQDDLAAARSRVSVAEAVLEQARADAALSQAQYENTLIRAPFDGVVLKKMAEVGESVAPIPPGVNLSTSSGAIVALADLDTLEVEADVAEANVARLLPDQPAEVAVEAFPDRRFKAVLKQVIPTADRTRATVQVKVTILDKDPDLKPEMSARVTFVRPGTEAPAGAPPEPLLIRVPEGAVVMRDGKPVVFEIRDGRVTARTVTTGPARDGQVVVREGLQGSERIVASPPATLEDGDRVRERQ